MIRYVDWTTISSPSENIYLRLSTLNLQTLYGFDGRKILAQRRNRKGMRRLMMERMNVVKGSKYIDVQEYRKRATHPISDHARID